MKEKKILDALNDIDDKFIEEAMPVEKKAVPFKWLKAVACFILVLGVGAGIWTLTKKPDTPVDKTTSQEDVPVGKGENKNTENKEVGSETTKVTNENKQNTELYTEIAVLENSNEAVDENYWKKLDINQQYNFISLDKSKYENTNTEIEFSVTDQKIADTIASGTDLYSKKTYTKNAEVFSVRTIDSSCAVAVKFKEESKYFVYINRDCKFKTLGELIDKLTLGENIAISKAIYHLDDADVSAIKYKPFEKDTVFTKLLDGKTLPVSDKKSITSTEYMVIHFTINHIYYAYNSDCCFVIDPSGYLTVHVLKNDYHFFIGEEKVTDFIKYVYANYEGKRLVDTTDTPVVYNGAIEITEKYSEGYKP